MDALLMPTFFCPKAWEGMSGNEATRFCSYCSKHVHNLDALPASERLALLSSPAAKLCARYQVAIRRPAKGREQSYYRHLLKYGAGVATVGSVLVVLWEMEGAAEKEKYYQAAGHPAGCAMPPEYYEEQRGYLKGDVDYSSVEKRTALLRAQEKEAAEAQARANTQLVIDQQTLARMLEKPAGKPPVPLETETK